MAVIGLIGASILPIAWLIQTYRTYEAGNLEAVDPRFVALYVLGSFLLAVHSFQIKDMTFLALNITMTFFTATELFLIMVVKRDL